MPRDSQDDLDALYERARSLTLAGDAGGRGDPQRRSLIEACLEAGREALRRIAAEGAQSILDPRHLTGLEAIVRLTGRPSFLIQDASVIGVPRDSEWYEPLVGAEPALRQVVGSVGRVNLPEGGPPGYVGTAFLVAEGIVMTNRHVAKKFSQRKRKNEWTLASSAHPTVDFVCEHQRSSPPPWRVTGVPLVHSKIDLALLRVEPTDKSADGPLVLPLGSHPAAIVHSRQVYTVGFPANDPEGNAKVIKEIFGEIFKVKRLAPGEIMAPTAKDGSFSHDCTTLGGNSGSCVLDFSNHRVLGLHFAGEYQWKNGAISLPELIADEELSLAGVQYE